MIVCNDSVEGLFGRTVWKDSMEGHQKEGQSGRTVWKDCVDGQCERKDSMEGQCVMIVWKDSV